jgi:hypothetical protein
MTQPKPHLEETRHVHQLYLPQVQEGPESRQSDSGWQERQVLELRQHLPHA